MYTGPGISLSPSFNSYSNYNIAEIAARVVEIFRADNTSEEFYDEFCIENKENSSTQKVEVDEEAANSGSLEIEDKNDDDFDFAFVAKETEFSSPISADEIFYNGQIRPVFPIYKRGILLGNINIENENKNTENLGSTRAPKIRVPLRKLFIEERETTSSSSSSETDELDNLPPGTYCVWKPKAAEAARQCKKSSSAGSSKRWKFRDLLHRSNSDGRKDGFVFLNPSNRDRERENDKTEKEEETPAVAASARKGDERRRDVVRFFAIVNGLSRNLHPFN